MSRKPEKQVKSTHGCGKVIRESTIVPILWGVWNKAHALEEQKQKRRAGAEEESIQKESQAQQKVTDLFFCGLNSLRKSCKVGPNSKRQMSFFPLSLGW